MSFVNKHARGVTATHDQKPLSNRRQIIEYRYINTNRRSHYIDDIYLYVWNLSICTAYYIEHIYTCTYMYMHYSMLTCTYIVSYVNKLELYEHMQYR